MGLFSPKYPKSDTPGASGTPAPNKKNAPVVRCAALALKYAAITAAESQGNGITGLPGPSTK